MKKIAAAAAAIVALTLAFLAVRWLAQPRQGCPPDMAAIAGGHACIDRYEASIAGGELGKVDGTGTSAVALSEKGRLPQEQVSFLQAEKACSNAGKRMCTSKEWMGACKGPGLARKFPYGAALEPGRCNTWNMDEKLRGPGKAVPTGSFERCRTVEAEIFDLSGNVWELIDESGVRGPDARQVCGGGFGNSDDEDLACRCGVAQTLDYAVQGVGFRCCRDL